MASSFGKTVDVTGVNQNGIDEVNKRKAEFEANGHLLNFQQAYAAALPFGDNTFEAAYALSLFSAIPLEVRQKAFDEAFRVLKPGGTFTVVDFRRADHDEAKESMYKEA